MRLRTARMPKRLLLGLPPVWLGAAIGHTGGGAAALLGWVLFCALLPGTVYPYPRKSRCHAARLFFSWAAGFCTLSLMMRLSRPGILYLPGAAALAVWAAAFFWGLPLSRKGSVRLGLLFLFSACM